MLDFHCPIRGVSQGLEIMDDVVNQIMANPLFSLVLALLAFLLIFLILKSLFRIAIFLVVEFVLYAGYIHFFQEKYPLPEFPDIITKFNSLKRGEHRADLFRYYYLYINFSVYILRDLSECVVYFIIINFFLQYYYPFVLVFSLCNINKYVCDIMT